MKFEFPDEDIMTLDNCKEFRPYDKPEQGSQWTLFFDGASNALGNGINTVLISTEGCHTPFTSRLCSNCTPKISMLSLLLCSEAHAKALIAFLKTAHVP